jgi:hypothetical protein
VTSGLDPADRTVTVEVGELGGGEKATISFRVKIADALPGGLEFVENQAVITGLGLEPSVSDDPTTVAVNDPTQTPVSGAIILKATLAVFPTEAGPIKDGTRLLYNPVIDNRGNSDATDVVISGTLSPTTVLAVGSIEAGRGVVKSADSSSFTIEFDVLPAGELVGMAMEVTVTGMPGGGEISNQFVVTAGNLIGEVRTDNPATIEPDDSTKTPVAPAVERGATWLPIIWGGE